METNNLQELRERCFGTAVLPSEVLTWIEENKLWNLWVPESYGGLELSFSEGLRRLKQLASIDGSLGWTVTLCSGANYFIGNLKETAAREIFLKSQQPACLGGSGAVSGTAERSQGHYRISGKWPYATGAPYLTHFTLNAEIHENGKRALHPDGSPQVRSFVVPRKAVQIIEDWNTMGLKATASHSFEVKDVLVHESFSFHYNEQQLPHPIFKIPFSVFADLTLWVNYLGIAEHLVEEARTLLTSEKLRPLEDVLSTSTQKIFQYAQEVEERVSTKTDLKAGYLEKVHREAAASVRRISRGIVELHPFLGIRASRKDHPLNQVFCDYFTATQHHIFTKEMH